MLTGREIVKQVGLSNIIINPFHIEQVNPNSYDIRLSKYIYELHPRPVIGTDFISPFDKDSMTMIPVPCEDLYEREKLSLKGAILKKEHLYLASTIEVIGSNKYVPVLEGKSSVARLGISIHQSAGFGDVGFINHWTLEIIVKENILVYPGMKIGQISFHPLQGEIELYKGNYKDVDPTPSKSRLYNSINEDEFISYYNNK
jgi:dCTP deaminase